ncbi:hypothetical protein MSAN_01258600 [Mycena sanguinolenta]|uniref:Protein kinase domain-containing protein n=1 Tax=Mycena sanguinolenta TaxID=230812 RepID=A0A8H7D220_9AGAR|nr:hypothetical protein MSAN_01258600 [Mycena sanguinolenta]
MRLGQAGLTRPMEFCSCRPHLYPLYLPLLVSRVSAVPPLPRFPLHILAPTYYLYRLPPLHQPPRETALSDILSPGQKTHAFFASPFPSASPFPTRPPSPLPSANASTSTITPVVPVIVPPSPPEIVKKRDFLWLDLYPRSVEDLSTVPSPVSLQTPIPDETTPKLPSLTPQQPLVQEELAIGSIIRARAPPRSRTISTDNSGVLESGTSSPLTQSPLSRISGLPDTTTSHAVPFSGLPASSDIGTPVLKVDPPKSPGITLRLTAPLGTGAFSSVWLAEDLSDDPLVLRSRRSLRNLRRETSLSLSRASSLRKVRVPGVRPLGAGVRMLAEQERSSTLLSPSNSIFSTTRLVALKMTVRSAFAQPCSKREEALQRDRTRVSFVREVEVLRHIAHPNITKLLTHLTTPGYHVLVLPYLPGGDLLSLVNSDDAHGALTETLLRRMWCELCKAVGWMHGVGLVHRDVKLENILLTTPFPFAGAPPSGPLIKLTDFGLSRFIDIEAPLLSTRCGSEAYAAPELVISGRRYDARETDAWACGVVLYALCGRRLPFGEGAIANTRADEVGPGRIGREGGAREGAAARRHWLMCIARGEYEWPSPAPASASGEGSGDSMQTVVAADGDKSEPEPIGELMGLRLIESEGARGIVARLLVRDPTRRAKISEFLNGHDVSSSNAASSGVPLISTDVETQSPGAAGSPDSDETDGFRENYADLDGFGEVEGFEDEDLGGGGRGRG